MKKSFLNALIFTLFFFITENGVSQNSEIEFTDLNTTDELFKIKSTINKTNSIAFLNQFYIVSLVEEADRNDKISKKEEMIFALNNLIKNENFSCGQLDVNKIEKLIKNSNSKNEILQGIENNIESFSTTGSEEGIKLYRIIKLTNEAYGVIGRACGSGGGYFDQYLFLLDQEEDENPSYIESSDFINGIMFNAKRKLESTFKTKFKRQYQKALSFGTTTINGENYIILPYFEGKENPGGFVFNLLIAYNIKNNKFYYLYDNPKTNTDNWKYDEEGEDSHLFVPMKNPKWVILK